jgi:hypothetical protein
MRYVERDMKLGLALALAASLAALALSGCKSSSAKKLEGRWHGIKATGVTADQRGAANLFASTMELEFHGNQVSVHVGNDRQSTRFQVVQDAKSSVVIAADGARETFTFHDDRTMDWAVQPGKTIEFQKE